MALILKLNKTLPHGLHNDNNTKTLFSIMISYHKHQRKIPFLFIPIEIALQCQLIINTIVKLHIVASLKH